MRPTHRRVPQPGRARNRPGATSKLAEALQAVLDAQGGDQAEIREIIARLDRMAAEVARIELVVAGETVGVGQ